MTLARLVASGGGAGFLPRAPGTWGSLLAILVGAALLALGGRWLVAAGVVLATAAGLWAIPRTIVHGDPAPSSPLPLAGEEGVRVDGPPNFRRVTPPSPQPSPASGRGSSMTPPTDVDHDPGWVVIDEVAGMWLALLPLDHPAPLGLLLAFGLFRLLDIAKPGPVGWLDRMEGRVGVMGDDLAAGLGAAFVLWALHILGLPF